MGIESYSHVESTESIDADAERKEFFDSQKVDLSSLFDDVKQEVDGRGVVEKSQETIDSNIAMDAYLENEFSYVSIEGAVDQKALTVEFEDPEYFEKVKARIG